MIGRKSGEVRESPVVFVKHAELYVVVASNAASDRPPAWWFNLQAEPECEAFVGGRWRELRARKATTEETEELRPELDRTYAGFEYYRQIATRDLPLVILEPR